MSILNLNDNRSWIVLLIGGVSGSGKSSLAYALGRHYGVSVLEADDIHQALKAATTAAAFPVLHSGESWREITVDDNVNWLAGVSRELAPALRAVVLRHLEDALPVIIEGDFIHPRLAASLNEPRVATLFLQEPDRDQLLRNYASREGGAPQCFRADISLAYGKWQAEACRELGLATLDARPWDTALGRAVDRLKLLV